ncbi:alpha/beta hydrolase [Methanosarcina hadiensis]|uniref:alpha/beta fold hydrolase n=1 Tax=Methanosarcina hadiensis TaxID=3078083 RepID=UPI0039773E3B
MTSIPGERNDSYRSGYASVNGLRMYYEIHGTGSPLVLLHGSLTTIDTSFGRILPSLAKTKQVIAVEQQGHGHTADIDRPLTYEQMAEDTTGLLKQLGIEKADFLGYSMGGAIALQIAIKHPDLVRKLVAVSVSYSNDGLYPEILEGEEKMKPEDLDGTELQKAYERIAPNPENWHTLIEKEKQLTREFKGWTPDEVQAIRAPALIMIGDSDIIRPEHAVEIFRLLGGGVAGDLTGLPRSRLAVLPGTTHVTMVERSDWLLSMAEEFLDSPVPEIK